MELEVSKKVREAIKAKLVELGCHVDDELPDYIMILIANRRSNQEIESDLGLFLSDNTKKFVTWLTHVLKKLEQVTAGESGGPSTTTEEPDAAAGEKGGDANNKSSEKADGGKKSDKKAAKLKRERKHSSSHKETSEKKVKNLEKKEKSLHNKKEKNEDKVEKKSSNEKTEQPSEEKTQEEEEKSSTSKTDHQEELVSRNKKKVITIQRNDPVKASEPPKESKVLISSEFVIKPDDEDKNNQENVIQENASVVNTAEDFHSGHDTLILDTGENEFSENVEELRRIALESQRRMRKDKQEDHKEEEDDPKPTKDAKLSSKRVHQRKLITNILMGRVNEEKELLAKSPRKMIQPTSLTEKRITRSSSDNKPVEYYSSTTRTESYRTRHSSRNSSSRHEKSPPSRRILRERKSVERSHHSSSRNNGKHDTSTTRDSRRSEKSPISVFRRIGSSTRRSSNTRSRSRSRSPIIRRKLTSRIGNVIRRSRSSSISTDESPIKNSVSSVIKVTERPRRDLHLNNKMLLRAVADAQQSIIQTEQNNPTAKPKPEKVQDDAQVTTVRSGGDQSRKRKSDENINQIEVITNKRRFTDFPEVDTTEFYEPTEPAIKRISVKERLGIKRELRRPVRERLGIIQNHPQSPMHVYENQPYSPSNDYKIMINVSDETSGINGQQRNVVLATNNTKRISIQVNNNSEEDDSSSDESMASTEESPKKREDSNKTQNDIKDTTFETEFQLAITDEDKLPEVPTIIDSEQEEYEYEEIVEEEEVKDSEEAESSVTAETTQELSSQASTVDSHLERNFSITINKKSTTAPVTVLQTNLPDLRTLMSKAPPHLPAAVNGSSGVKCKFWPKCQFKNKCIYEHPLCKYSPCKNKDCIYKHNNFVKHENFEKPKPPPKLVCKFYPKCTSMNCKFHHPSPCRFGVGCTDSRCENYHPGVTLGLQKLKAKGVKLIPQANQLKWVKK